MSNIILNAMAQNHASKKIEELKKYFNENKEEITDKGVEEKYWETIMLAFLAGFDLKDRDNGCSDYLTCKENCSECGT